MLETCDLTVAAPTNRASAISMLLDPDFELTNLYGVRWNEGEQTAYPSTFLIDGTGTITFAKVSDGVRGRTSGAEMAEMLK